MKLETYEDRLKCVSESIKFLRWNGNYYSMRFVEREKERLEKKIAELRAEGK